MIATYHLHKTEQEIILVCKECTATVSTTNWKPAKEWAGIHLRLCPGNQ
jgi:hypothetical protein